MEYSQARKIIDYFSSKEHCLAVCLVQEDNLTVRLTLGEPPMLFIFSDQNETITDMEAIENKIQQLLKDQKSPIIEIDRSIRKSGTSSEDGTINLAEEE